MLLHADTTFTEIQRNNAEKFVELFNFFLDETATRINADDAQKAMMSGTICDAVHDGWNLAAKARKSGETTEALLQAYSEAHAKDSFCVGAQFLGLVIAAKSERCPECEENIASALVNENEVMVKF